MSSLDECFKLNTTKDKLSALLDLRQDLPEEKLNVESILEWLKGSGITFGLNHDHVKQVVSSNDPTIFPIEIARGTAPKKGVDGQIEFFCERTDQIELDEKRNFRDVKKIPSLTVDEKIAVITKPTKGQPGRTVFDKVLPAKDGKPVKMRAGKNVRFDEMTSTFYATSVGQVSVGPNIINVFDTYEVNGDLSMKTGNIKFVGSVIIRGNVPAGYCVEAEGDVHIYGLVEAGHVEAGGNVVITEGIAGLKKGTVKAGGNVTISYINQATVEAQKDIIVQNSIMHSQCVAKEHIYCNAGNIIGGSTSAGIAVEAKDIGNKMDTKTEIAIGIDHEQAQLENKLNQAKQTLESELKKLNILGEGIEKKSKLNNGLDPKDRILLLKQRNSVQLTEKKLGKINEQISALHVEIGDEDKARLIVKGSLYPNVDLCFGKYRKTTDVIQKFTQVFIDDGEIHTQPL